MVISGFVIGLINGSLSSLNWVLIGIVARSVIAAIVAIIAVVVVVARSEVNGRFPFSFGVIVSG